MFGILSMFSVLGGTLYERRDELGIETRRSPERTAERLRLEDLEESEARVTEAYGQMRVGSHAKAWALLQGWLATRGSSIENYRWLCDRLARWGDARYANRMTEEYLERLLALREDGQALDAAVHRLGEDPAFRPKTAASTLRIAELAARGGGVRRVARILLEDYGRRFAGDPRAAAAQALARQLGIEPSGQ